jgi:hypothetical protein
MWWILALVAAVAVGVMLGIREVRSWRKPAKGNPPEGLGTHTVEQRVMGVWAS